MKSIILTKSLVHFVKEKKEITLVIIHNLPPRMKTVNLETTLNLWLEESKIFTDTSLADFINNRNDQFIAITEDQFKKHNNPNQDGRNDAKIIQLRSNRMGK